MTIVVMVDGKHEIMINADNPQPIPYAWDMDGQPIYRRDPLVEFTIELGADEE
jgi:hypothetical protein